MRINSVQINFEHEGVNWRAIFCRKHRASGVIKNPDTPEAWVALPNATDYEVLEYLEGQGIPTEQIVRRLAVE